MSSRTWTIREVLDWAAEDFARRGIESARLDAELLVAKALGIDRVGLYLDLSRPLLEEERSAIRPLVARRREREPVAYILGYKDFYGRRFLVTPEVLIPRPDTETLVDHALACIDPRAACRVLDVGTGSGIFAEAFAKLGLDIEGVDANPEMLTAARNQVEGVRFQEGTAESLPYPDSSFDLVFMGLLFHETDDRLKAMQEAARVTRQQVAVLEWPYEQQEFGPGLDARLTEKEIGDLATQAGLTISNVVRLQSLVFYLLSKQ